MVFAWFCGFFDFHGGFGGREALQMLPGTILLRFHWISAQTKAWRPVWGGFHCIWPLLRNYCAIIGYYWPFLRFYWAIIRYYWFLLRHYCATIGFYWPLLCFYSLLLALIAPLLALLRHYWPLLVAIGRHWSLLAAIRRCSFWLEPSVVIYLRVRGFHSQRKGTCWL